MFSLQIICLFLTISSDALVLGQNPTLRRNGMPKDLQNQDTLWDEKSNFKVIDTVNDERLKKVPQSNNRNLRSNEALEFSGELESSSMQDNGGWIVKDSGYYEYVYYGYKNLENGSCHRPLYKHVTKINQCIASDLHPGTSYRFYVKANPQKNLYQSWFEYFEDSQCYHTKEKVDTTQNIQRELILLCGFLAPHLYLMNHVIGKPLNPVHDQLGASILLYESKTKCEANNFRLGVIESVYFSVGVCVPAIGKANGTFDHIWSECSKEHGLRQIEYWSKDGSCSKGIRRTFTYRPRDRCGKHGRSSVGGYARGWWNFVCQITSAESKVPSTLPTGRTTQPLYLGNTKVPSQSGEPSQKSLTVTPTKEQSIVSMAPSIVSTREPTLSIFFSKSPSLAPTSSTLSPSAIVPREPSQTAISQPPFVSASSYPSTVFSASPTALQTITPTLSTSKKPTGPSSDRPSVQPFSILTFPNAVFMNLTTLSPNRFTPTQEKLLEESHLYSNGWNRPLLSWETVFLTSSEPIFPSTQYLPMDFHLLQSFLSEENKTRLNDDFLTSHNQTTEELNFFSETLFRLSLKVYNSTAASFFLPIVPPGVWQYRCSVGYSTNATQFNLTGTFQSNLRIYEGEKRDILFSFFQSLLLPPVTSIDNQLIKLFSFLEEQGVFNSTVKLSTITLLAKNSIVSPSNDTYFLSALSLAEYAGVVIQSRELISIISPLPANDNSSSNLNAPSHRRQLPSSSHTLSYFPSTFDNPDCDLSYFLQIGGIILSRDMYLLDKLEEFDTEIDIWDMIDVRSIFKKFFERIEKFHKIFTIIKYIDFFMMMDKFKIASKCYSFDSNAPVSMFDDSPTATLQCLKDVSLPELFVKSQNYNLHPNGYIARISPEYKEMITLYFNIYQNFKSNVNNFFNKYFDILQALNIWDPNQMFNRLDSIYNFPVQITRKLDSNLIESVSSTRGNCRWRDGTNFLYCDCSDISEDDFLSNNNMIDTLLFIAYRTGPKTFPIALKTLTGEIYKDNAPPPSTSSSNYNCMTILEHGEYTNLYEDYPSAELYYRFDPCCGWPVYQEFIQTGRSLFIDFYGNGNIEWNPNIQLSNPICLYKPYDYRYYRFQKPYPNGFPDNANDGSFGCYDIHFDGLNPVGTCRGTVVYRHDYPPNVLNYAEICACKY